jgi:hypothetical protein
VAAWVQDLMQCPHPTFSPGDFTIVEDTGSGKIVSSLCLISQTWSYEGIQFGVGRPELVGTHPEYRRRGLVRAQFEVIHNWSEERGEAVQAITGIPWYYRQFGYEMAMTLGGSRGGYRPQVPKLKDGESEPYLIRPAGEADLSFIAQVYEQSIKRYPVACVRDHALWRYELLGRSEKNVNRQEFRVIETLEKDPVGFLAHRIHPWQGRLDVWGYELRSGVSWLAVTPSVVRYLWTWGEETAAQDPNLELAQFSFALGAEHPVYQVFDKGLPRRAEPYAWYLRVADLPGFLSHIAPALERRLAASPLVGHSGEVKISFYRSGLRLVFEQGHLETVESWQPTVEEGGNAAFPGLTFLQLLFGYRSLEELDHAYADCWTGSDEARALLEALFAKRPSDVWPVS